MLKALKIRTNTTKINKAIQKHAIILGWTQSTSHTIPNTTSDAIILNGTTFSISSFDEIFQVQPHTRMHWQDFLKLSKSDVILQDGKSDLPNVDDWYSGVDLLRVSTNKTKRLFSGVGFSEYEI